MPWRNQSPFEDLVEIAAKFPWWVGVVVAVVAYLMLHPVATMDIATSSSAGEIVYPSRAR